MTGKLCFAALCGALCCAALGCASCGDEGATDRPDAWPLPDAEPVVDAPAAPDRGRDTGPPIGDYCPGGPCTPDRGCRSGTCMAERSYAIGGPTDPITGYPDGEETPIAGLVWPGGYCTTAEVNYVDAPGACDPAVETSCGDPECAICLNVGQQDGRALSMCAGVCAASLTVNPCRDGQTCLLGSNVCFSGCSSDDECRVSRRDTNMNGEIDPYDAATNPMGDHLVYDDSTNATCDPVVFRCVHDGVTGAEAGMPCEHDFACEASGDCITAAGWTDADGEMGYCTKFGCNTPGNDCTGGGVCQERRIGTDLCLAACTVAAEAGTPDWASGMDVFGAGGHGVGCRPGYSCAWNGVDGAGVTGNGACVPGEYNDVTTANIAAACTDDATCYSPFGAGACLSGGVWGPSNYCSMLDCGAPGMPGDVCGPDTQCVTLFEDITACLADCATAADCAPGHACLEYDGDPATSKVCFPICLGVDDCRTGETCNIPPGEMSGTCE